MELMELSRSHSIPGRHIGPLTAAPMKEDPGKPLLPMQPALP